MKKTVISVLVLLIIIWGVTFFIDYSRCRNFKEPIFVVARVTSDDGGSGTYYGLGYKVKIEKTILAEYGQTLVKVEMYMFNKFIVGTIADTNNNSINEDYKKVEKEQHEFVATIIEADDSYIVVEPEDGTNERKSSDKIKMNINRQTNGTNYEIGNKVKITYNGAIMESYPAQIIATKIELAK